MCSSSGALQNDFDVCLLQTTFLGEELKTISVEGQMGCCYNDSTIILITYNTELKPEIKTLPW